MKKLTSRTLFMFVFACAASACAELRDTDAIDAYLEQAVAGTKIPGLVALVVDADETLYMKAVGLRNGAQQRSDDG